MENKKCLKPPTRCIYIIFLFIYLLFIYLWKIHLSVDDFGGLPAVRLAMLKSPRASHHLEVLKDHGFNHGFCCDFEGTSASFQKVNLW